MCDNSLAPVSLSTCLQVTKHRASPPASLTALVVLVSFLQTSQTQSVVLWDHVANVELTHAAEHLFTLYVKKVFALLTFTHIQIRI